MSNVYAMVEAGVVTNVVMWDGPGVVPSQDSSGIEIAAWVPPEGVEMILVTDETGPAHIGGAWDGVQFVAPPAPPVPPITAAQVLARRDGLLADAALRIAPLQDAVDLDEATAAEIAALQAWKQYRVALNRIDQQTGFPAAVDWPQVPA